MTIDANDFGGWIVQRLYRMRQAISLDDYTATDEIKLLRGIVACLRELQAFRESGRDEHSGSEIRKYSTAFAGRGHDAARSRAADQRAEAPVPNVVEFSAGTDDRDANGADDDA